MTRDPFSFLSEYSHDKVLLLLLQALIKRSDGEVRISVKELTQIADGDSLLKYPSDTGEELVLRFAKKGAEAFFLSEPIPQPRSPRRQTTDSQPPLPRHSVKSDVELALQEEEIAERQRAIQKQRLEEARAASGAMPWRTVQRTQ